MRYLENENPYIWVRFTTGDSVTITIYKTADDSVVVNAASMSELSSTGFFKYQFNPSPTELTEYFYIATNSIEEHAGKIILGGYPDNIKNQTDKMNFTGDDIKATLDGEEVTTDTASRNASKADVSTIENNVSKILQIEKGNWEIKNNQMIFYAENGTDELYKFNLKNKAGVPSETDIFKREAI